MNHAYDYCKTPAKVTKRELVNAVHELTLQLRANGNRPYSEGLGTDLDNLPAIATGEHLLCKARHLGFTP